MTNEEKKDMDALKNLALLNGNTRELAIIQSNVPELKEELYKELADKLLKSAQK